MVSFLHTFYFDQTNFNLIKFTWHSCDVRLDLFSVCFSLSLWSDTKFWYSPLTGYGQYISLKSHCIGVFFNVNKSQSNKHHKKKRYYNKETKKRETVFFILFYLCEIMATIKRLHLKLKVIFMRWVQVISMSNGQSLYIAINFAWRWIKKKRQTEKGYMRAQCDMFFFIAINKIQFV